MSKSQKAPAKRNKRKRNPPTRKTLNVYQLGVAGPKRVAKFKEPTPEQRIAAGELAKAFVSQYEAHAYSMNPVIAGRYRGKGIELPPLASPKWRESFLGIIEGILRPKDLTDRIEGDCGAFMAEVADIIVKSSDGTATLGELLNELESGLDQLRAIVDEFGKEALLTTSYDPDQDQD